MAKSSVTTGIDCVILTARDIEKGHKTKTKEKHQNQTKNTYP